ncbi:MAG: hypothetical protein RL160_852, partial [Bacteroidota bacterium]
HIYMQFIPFPMVNLSLLLMHMACQTPESKRPEVARQHISAATTPSDKPTGDAVATRFSCPDGCTRIPLIPGSFGAYLRQFPLKPHGTAVYYHDGQEKVGAAHAAVLQLSTGTENLQQCADAVMRLRAEYLYQKKAYTQLHFNFTNNFSCRFDKWMQGCRVKVNGNQTSWACSQKPDSGRSSFDAWMKQVFMFAGTLSLERELQPIAATEVQPGDVWIKGGSPGHAVMVMDVCQDSAGNRYFLLAQSYMPAQDMHVLRNYRQPELSPWFKVPANGQELETPEWTFQYNQLRRFR